jgi:hypothetical protein
MKIIDMWNALWGVNKKNLVTKTKTKKAPVIKKKKKKKTTKKKGKK